MTRLDGLTPTQIVCLAALVRDPLRRDRTRYRYRDRGFSPATVALLVERGLAKRIGAEAHAAGRGLAAMKGRRKP